MARVLGVEVQNLLNNQTIDPDPAIEIADVLVDDQLVGKGLSETMLDKIALFLAGHFALLMSVDGPLATQEVGEARERYHNIYGPGLQSTVFGQQAIMFDTSGTLSKLAAKASNPKLGALFTVVGSNVTQEELE
jgi:hypothetical protein